MKQRTLDRRPNACSPLRPVFPAGGGGVKANGEELVGLIPGWVVAASQHLGRVGSGRREQRRGNQGDSCRSSAGKGRSRRAAGAAGCGGMGRAPRRAPGGEAPTGSAPWHPQLGGGVETGDTCLFRHRHVRRSCFRRAPWAGPRRVRTWRVGPHGPVLAASARGESAPLKCLGGAEGERQAGSPTVAWSPGLGRSLDEERFGAWLSVSFLVASRRSRDVAGPAPPLF